MMDKKIKNQKHKIKKAKIYRYFSIDLSQCQPKRRKNLGKFAPIRHSLLDQTQTNPTDNTILKVVEEVKLWKAVNCSVSPTLHLVNAVAVQRAAID
jgi:hypothetical protein